MVSAVDSPVLNWSGHFLIAMPGMEDPGFARSVVYICEHTERGALGLCVNKPLGLTFSELFEQIKLPLKRNDLHDRPVCWGGPLQPERGRGAGRHRPHRSFRPSSACSGETTRAGL